MDKTCWIVDTGALKENEDGEAGGKGLKGGREARRVGTFENVISIIARCFLRSPRASEKCLTSRRFSLCASSLFFSA